MPLIDGFVIGFIAVFIINFTKVLLEIRCPDCKRFSLDPKIKVCGNCGKIKAVKARR